MAPRGNRRAKSVPKTSQKDLIEAADEHRRPRGRPKTEIDLDLVADAVAGLFVEGGMDAVSIVGAAKKLDVSRATLYRTVPTKEHLLGVLFERSTKELTEMATAVVDSDQPIRAKLAQLIELQVDAAVRMRRYLPVFFGGIGLPSDVFKRWHSWSRKYEAMWTTCVQEAMDEGVLAHSHPVAATRLILGQCIWVSRWYRPNEGIATADIAEAAINLVLHAEPAKATRRRAKRA
ncbi:TetR/AcrR family transcriptional regulator [Mycobacterium sherrisii]|uniref:TetR/AcrR family transcriptional regulator n=1 Tax=Mycobacterium sherrisii TaxID=243061 RepID=UPI00114FE8B7|nr:TetR/AcrR family transcriptional regulator [Mycobacterium sherrisii]MCV7032516.1 TetR/AcrR family transcriptional regulator [Mycobacterium sherrisii]